jgi:hypothetical protein
VPCKYETLNPDFGAVSSSSLRARPRCLSWLLTPVLSRAFARATRGRLDALKEAAEQRGLLADG